MDAPPAEEQVNLAPCSLSLFGDQSSMERSDNAHKDTTPYTKYLESGNQTVSSPHRGDQTRHGSVILRGRQRDPIKGGPDVGSVRPGKHLAS